MYVDLWGWFDKCESGARLNGDILRQRMIQAAYEGWEYRRLAESENAIRAFEEGLKIARLLHEPWWEVFYQHWIAVIHLYVQYDYQKSLDAAVRLVTEIRKDKYRDCPVRGSIVYFLAKIYFILDLRIYETQILELLDYLEKEVGMDEDTYLQMLATYAEIEVHHARYEAAREKAQSLINLSTNKPYRLYDGYRLLRRLAYIEGDIVSALSYNRIAQTHAQAMRVQSCIADERLWEALLLRYAGDELPAREAYYDALRRYEQYLLPRDSEYHTVCSEFLALDGQIEEAAKLLEAWLRVAAQKPGTAPLVEAYCVYIGFLGRHGRDFSRALAKARELAQSLEKPESYLERLSRLEAGQHFDFDWQKSRGKQ